MQNQNASTEIPTRSGPEIDTDTPLNDSAKIVLDRSGKSDNHHTKQRPKDHRRDNVRNDVAQKAQRDDRRPQHARPRVDQGPRLGDQIANAFVSAGLSRTMFPQAPQEHKSKQRFHAQDNRGPKGARPHFKGNPNGKPQHRPATRGK